MELEALVVVVKTKTTVTTANEFQQSWFKPGVEKWRSIVQKYFGRFTNQALAIMQCESNGRMNAVNWNDARWGGCPSIGAFQHHCPLRCVKWNLKTRTLDLSNCKPEDDIVAGYNKFKSRGWSPWRNCAAKLGLL